MDLIRLSLAQTLRTSAAPGLPKTWPARLQGGVLRRGHRCSFRPLGGCARNRAWRVGRPRFGRPNAARGGLGAGARHSTALCRDRRPRNAQGLRGEAEMVARWAARLALPHAILVWDGVKPASRIQERAREARYELLFEYAARNGADHVMTAHHADDQAETILFRLLRGSGISGLSGMATFKRTQRTGPCAALALPCQGRPRRFMRIAGAAFFRRSIEPQSCLCEDPDAAPRRLARGGRFWRRRLA